MNFTHLYFTRFFSRKIFQITAMGLGAIVGMTLQLSGFQPELAFGEALGANSQTSSAFGRGPGDHGGPGRGGPGRGGPGRGGPGRGGPGRGGPGRGGPGHGPVPPPPPPRPVPPPPRPMPPPSAGTETVRMTVGRQYQGTTRLNLTSLLQVAVQGREIVSLTVRMSAQGGRSQATLLENGRAVGVTQIVPAYSTDLNFYVQNPNSRNLLELNLNGPVYIGEVWATVRSFAGPIQLDGYIGMNYLNGGFINLNQLVGLQNYYGRGVRQVIIRANARVGAAAVSLITNGYRNPGSRAGIGPYLQDIYVPMTGMSTIGSALQSLDIQLEGNVYVERVFVQLY